MSGTPSVPPAEAVKNYCVLVGWIVEFIPWVFHFLRQRFARAPAGWSTRTALWVRLLLENDADVEARDSEEWSPFHWACQLGNVYTARLLIAAGE